MANAKAASKTTRQSAKRTTSKASNGFSAEEKAAVRERARELKRAANQADAENDLLTKISEMPQPDRGMAERFHALIRATAPDLESRTWYGMPAYAKDGHVICFYKGAFKFKTRYATVGFSDKANLDDGALWPTDFALKELTADAEARLTSLVKKAVS